MSSVFIFFSFLCLYLTLYHDDNEESCNSTTLSTKVSAEEETIV